MATIKSDKEKAKWAKIQSQAASGLDAILKAPDANEAMQKYEALAKTIFDEGIKNAESTADTILDKMNQERIDKGKKPLSEKAQERMFNVTLKSVLEESLPDILHNIEDTLSDLGESPDRSAFDRVRDVVNTVGDDTKKQDWAKKLYDGFFQEDRDTTKPKTSVVSKLLAKDRDANNDDEDLVKPKHKHTREKIEAHRKAKARRKTKKPRTWIDKLYALLARPEKEPEDEDVKAKSWLRQFTTTFGKFKALTTDPKSRLSKYVRWAKLAAMLLPFAPGIIKTIGDGLMKYCNWDSITGFLKDTWSTVQTWGSDGVDWVIDKIKSFFGSDSKSDKKETTYSKAKALTGNTTPEQLAQIQSTSNNIVNSTTEIAPQTDSSLGGKTTKEALKAQAAQDAKGIIHSNKEIFNLDNHGVSQTSSTNTTTNANQIALSAPSTTTVSAAIQPSMSAETPEPVVPQAPTVTETAPRAPIRSGGGNTVSLDTFGTQPGSDSFLMYNARVIGG